MKKLHGLHCKHIDDLSMHCVREKLIVFPKLLCDGGSQRGGVTTVFATAQSELDLLCRNTAPEQSWSSSQNSEPWGPASASPRGCQQLRKNCNNTSFLNSKLKLLDGPNVNNVHELYTSTKNSHPCCARCGTSPVLHNVDPRQLTLHKHGQVHKLHADCVKKPPKPGGRRRRVPGNLPTRKTISSERTLTHSDNSEETSADQATLQISGMKTIAAQDRDSPWPFNFSHLATFITHSKTASHLPTDIPSPSCGCHLAICIAPDNPQDDEHPNHLVTLSLHGPPCQCSLDASHGDIATKTLLFS